MNQPKPRVNLHDKQEELRAFLSLQKIDYTENRIQFYQEIETSLHPMQMLFMQFGIAS